MASAEEDNFDIDIYGDGEEEKVEPQPEREMNRPTDSHAQDTYDPTNPSIAGTVKQETDESSYVPNEDSEMVNGADGTSKEDVKHAIASTDASSQDRMNIPRQPPQQQGTQRKEGIDERSIENGATMALLISDLHWWSNDDDIRGWVNQSECEDELKDITFSEHKVNGKSKGQAFVEFSSLQASSAVKRKIESFGEGLTYGKKHSVIFTGPHNPYRTLPKDAPPRGKDGPRHHQSPGAQVGNPNGPMNYGMNNMGGGYRGGRGGPSHRGGPMNMGGYQNRHFSGPMSNPPAGSFQGGAPMGGYHGGQMGGAMPQYGAFNRGGMMGGMRGMGGAPRGGRGGMMGGMPMGGMGGMMGGGMPGQMGTMGGAMGMGPMGMQGTFDFSLRLVAAASGGLDCSWRRNTVDMLLPKLQSVSRLCFQRAIPRRTSLSLVAGRGHPSTALRSAAEHDFLGLSRRASVGRMLSHTLPYRTGPGGFQPPQPHFNPAFYPPNAGVGGDGSWNPHGTKRQRPE
ncbi:MAG: hypothetical protein M1817_003870 [Caeruleum heppii]|nr:MAG: hypothetical protein M1817_003870 [Caeruleum heppii]